MSTFVQVIFAMTLHSVFIFKFSIFSKTGYSLQLVTTTRVMLLVLQSRCCYRKKEPQHIQNQFITFMLLILWTYVRFEIFRSKYYLIKIIWMFLNHEWKFFLRKQASSWPQRRLTSNELRSSTNLSYINKSAIRATTIIMVTVTRDGYSYGSIVCTRL